MAGAADQLRIIRPMDEADLPAVLEVERQCYTHPWSEPQFRCEMEGAFSSVDLLLVDGELAGFLCSRYLQGELEVLNVATAPRFRRLGVARQMLSHVLGQAAQKGMDSAYLEVRAGNLAAVALYQSFGFRPSYRRRAYYPDGEDALVMELASS
ncbi:ribosomal-protein-alanine acetyltransferase [Desulfuromonas versatilis]|uniref:[Ribosomal protein bS18]-alanine N-acetyltransferase n=1 Tax=Desulfuromonas versatilis TaxID=2802975 RepID=A0ABM8HT65_9BACT|nr:ribosomal-protein-alanine acetyltransferase [Desulfuromonas versatilis]